MSTRCAIATTKDNGLFDAIYCHCDGYPEGVGETLKKHYTTEEKINKLIELGDLSSLGENIGEKVDFYKYVKEQCIAFHRDRGDEKSCSIDLGFNEFLKYCATQDIEFVYIFFGNQWHAFRINDVEEYKSLPLLNELKKYKEIRKLRDKEIQNIIYKNEDLVGKAFDIMIMANSLSINSSECDILYMLTNYARESHYNSSKLLEENKYDAAEKEAKFAKNIKSFMKELSMKVLIHTIAENKYRKHDMNLQKIQDIANSLHLDIL